MDGQSLLIAAIAGILFFTVSETVHGVKKLNHKIVHIFHKDKSVTK